MNFNRTPVKEVAAPGIEHNIEWHKDKARDAEERPKLDRLQEKQS